MFLQKPQAIVFRADCSCSFKWAKSLLDSLDRLIQPNDSLQVNSADQPWLPNQCPASLDLHQSEAVHGPAPKILRYTDNRRVILQGGVHLSHLG